MKDAKEILSKDILRNINLLYFIEQNPVYYSRVLGGSVLLKGKSDKEWVLISSKDSEEFKSLLSEMTVDDKCFAFLEDWMVPYITEGKKLKWILSTDQYYLEEDVMLNGPGHATQSLCPEDSKFIVEQSNYSEFLSSEYIAERISKAPSSCIKVGDYLVAWCLTHDDLAIGSLHVLPEFRKRGYGKSLLIDMAGKIRGSGKIPFCYIEAKNEKSINLVTAAGFKKDKSVVWVELE